MDVMRVHDGLKPIVERVRQTCRPALVELRTYRFKGHSMSDPRKYRTREEEQKYEEADPIDRLSHFLMATRGFAQQEYEALVEDVRRQVREAIEWAEASPPPPPEELYTDVYTDRWGPYLGTTPPPMMREEAP